MAEKTVTGNARVEGLLSSSNIFKGTFRRIFDLVNDSLTDPKADSRDKWIWTKLPEDKVETRDDYPRIILGLADMSGIPKITLDQRTANPYLYVQVYSTNKSEVDTLSDTFLDALIDNEDELDLDNLESLVASASTGEMTRSKFPVYYRSFRLEFSVEGI